MPTNNRFRGVELVCATIARGAIAGLQPLILPTFVVVLLTVSTPPALANAEEVPRAVIIRLTRSSDGEWEVRAPSGERACRLPCDVSVEGPEGWSVQRLNSTERIALPDTARFAPGTILDAQVRPKAGSVIGAAILTGFGVAALATGFGIILAGGCAGHDGLDHPYLCFTSLALVPLGLATGIAGGVWLALSHSGRVEIAGEHAPPPSPTVKISFSGSGVALRF